MTPTCFPSNFKTPVPPESEHETPDEPPSELNSVSRSNLSIKYFIYYCI